MAVCAACGAENGERARFCQGCGTSLGARPTVAPRHEPQAPTQAEGLFQTCAACQSKNPLAATACRTCRASLLPSLAAPSRKAAPVARRSNAGRLVLVGLVLASAAAGGWWFGTNRGKAASTAPRVAVVSPVGEPVASGVELAGTTIPPHAVLK